MQEYRSDRVKLSAGQQEVFDFLALPSNYEQLMPPSVREFTSGSDHAEINIQGIGKLLLGFEEMDRPHRILIRPRNKAPFPFHIEWRIDGDDHGCWVEAHIEAELNFMMRMMADQLLKGFLNTQVERLRDIFAQ